MFAQLRALFQRYANQHRVLHAPSFALSGNGHIGQVDHVTLHGAEVCFEGWSSSDSIVLISDTGRSEVRPNILRQDVADTYGVDNLVGFQIKQRFGNGQFTFSLSSKTSPQRNEVHVLPFAKNAWDREQRRLMRSFVWRFTRLAPALAWGTLTKSPDVRQRVKAALGLEAHPTRQPMDTGLFDLVDEEVSGPNPKGVTIIIPVYNAFDLLQECLDRIIRHTNVPWRLILIEDASSDPQVLPWLRNWVADVNARGLGEAKLLVNASNKGFICSTNRGLEAAMEYADHVVLMNSDAFVPKGWATRLLRPLEAHANVASATPMSNDAEICSVPLICQARNLSPGQGDAIDAQAQRFHPDVLHADAPTGVGFCMALDREWIARLPKFDQTFGRGYGEEVDWCQRVRALGGRHLVVPGLFVEHSGGKSFGRADKNRLVAKNGAIISKRYPNYDAEVQQFIATDPLATARLALAVAWVATEASEGRVSIYVAHALGGGADIYLERRIAEGLAKGQPALILRLGTGLRWQLEVVTDAGRCIGATDDLKFLKRLLAPIKERNLIYSCAVGDSDPMNLPSALLTLVDDSSDSIEVLVHDYFMVSPSYTLLDAQGQYWGPVGSEANDPAHSYKGASLADWQSAWRLLLSRASHITTFSENSAMHMRVAYPDLSDRIRVCPHKMLHSVKQLQPSPEGQRVIGVLGSIGYQKGAAVLRQLAGRLRGRQDISLVVLGDVDPAWVPPSHVPVHGSYRLEDLESLVALYGITDWLIPSIWPETFSFTTHEALSTGLLTYAFDIGAQGDAVREAHNGRSIVFEADGQLAENVIRAIEASVREPGELSA